MKKFVCTTLIILNVIWVQAQDTSELYAEKTSSIDSLITNLYSVISGEKGEERNWNLMKHLFYANSKLIPTGRNKEGDFLARYMTVDDYINTSGKWLTDNGFFEKEIHRTVDVFGNIAQVFSTYEAFNSEADEKPFMRGINSIQLLFDENRWWIVNIFWMQETPNNPIPEMYLPKH
ncbi:hypothetical protein [Hanstruepera marina]|uniref:hypothetical protein n=1 Tax=Hanstruepera marina TaxID=2873265 RepID=UPI001CA701DA|nr:hypothetical protein [Hanstruepera marina]